MIHPIPPEMFCVPAALIAITGEDARSVVIPALNRASHNVTLIDHPGGVLVVPAETALKELGYRVRRCKELGKRSLKQWAIRASTLSSPVLVATCDHMLVTYRGRVYDTSAPYGPFGEMHPYARHTITYAAIVEKR